MLASFKLVFDLMYLFVIIFMKQFCYSTT